MKCPKCENGDMIALVGGERAMYMEENKKILSCDRCGHIEIVSITKEDNEGF